VTLTDLLNVDLTQRKVAREPLSEELEALGGHGLTSAVVGKEVHPEADPLGPGNVLVFAAGIFAGTVVPNGGRLSVGGKSPLTGGIKEANSGGSAARDLADLGLRAIKVSGQADELSVLVVTKEGGELVPAPELAGLGSFATVDKLWAQYGDKVSLICCGPAGEMGAKASAVLVTTSDHYMRAAARGGLGAVMGSKKLKAIVIDAAGGTGVTVADPVALKEASKALTAGIHSHPAMAALEALGSAFLINVTQSMGCLATKNFSAGTWENAPAISGEHMVEIISSRPNGATKHSCMRGCIIHCSQVYTDDAGEVITSGVEFETLGLMGSNCHIDDLDTIARLDRLCDDLGLDTMDMGAALGVAMEGGLLEWGDGQGACDLLAKLTSGDADARMLAEGCATTGERLGVSRVPAVKGQSFAAYDPRVLKGTGTTYVTSPQGADHTCGNALPSPANPEYDPASAEGQAQISEFLQCYFAAIDSLGMCLFATLPALDMPELQGEFVKAAAAVTGQELPEDYLIRLGDGIVRGERDFNRRAGFTQKDDRPPAFVVEETVAPSGNTYDVPEADLDAMFAG
jgi:aldehyde:ferredoxin oxidoreductase